MAQVKPEDARVSATVCVSDTHIMCELGLCPGHRVRQDGGGYYMPSKFQRWLWRCWRIFLLM